MLFYVHLVIVLAILAAPIAVGVYLSRTLRMPNYGWIPLGLIGFAFYAAHHASYVVEEPQWGPFLAALGVLIVPLLAGIWFSQTVRMPDYGWKFSVILIALAGSVAVVWYGWPPKLGIDLSGGVTLVYEIDKSQQLDPNQKVEMDKLIAAVSRRVNPGGQKEVVIRAYGNSGVEIIIPRVAEEEVERIKGILQRAGSLEFRILANDRDHRALIDRAEAEPLGVKQVYEVDADGKPVLDEEGKPRVLARWTPVNAKEARGLLSYPEIAKRTVKSGETVIHEILVVMDPQNVTGGYLSRTQPATDRTGRPSVSFVFNNRGGQLFGQLTGDNLPEGEFTRKLGIILDGELYSAPSIQSTIFDQGEITGSFTPKEVNELVAVLNAGALPASLTKKPVTEQYTGATLGEDTVRRSAHAMLLSSILVPLFMLWYYRFSGMVANLALVLNMLMLVAIMIAIKAAFTLPGLAGLALTVGMAVDNNVLIYERLREELHRGAALRMAIRNAFHRAGVVIVDANLTHLIAATVLFIVGTEQVRGFAITFFLGAVLSIWATMFVARVMFEVAERRGWVTQMKMMQVIGETHFDFMRLFPATATFSVVITLLGLAVAFHRGRGLMDIDFTGGVSIQAVFRPEKPGEKPVDAEQVREALSDLPDLAVSDVRVGERQEGPEFVINTSEGGEGSVEKVSEDVKRAFGDRLVSNSLQFARVALIEPPRPKPAPEKPAEKTTEKPADKEPEKPAVKEPEKPADKEPEKPADKEPEKPADKEPEKPADKEPEKPAVKEPEKPADKEPEKPAVKEPEKPADKEPEKPADKESEKPAEKPVDKDSEKPADKPVEKGEPEAKEQSRRDLPPDSMLAMAEPSPLVLAQADRAAKDAADAAKSEQKPDSAKLPAEPKATDNQSPTAKAPAEPTAALISEAMLAPFIGGTEAKLDFRYKVTHETVVTRLKEALKSHGLADDQSHFELSLPDRPLTESDTTPYASWIVRLKLSPEKAKPVLDTMAENVKASPYFPGASKIGGAVAADTRIKAVYAITASWALIIIYLWIRFQGVAWGVAAVIALVHDVLVMLGAIALSLYVAPWFGWLMIDPFKINLPIVAGFMTIIGYSVNDTIVIFDRIREIRGKDPRITREMVNDATNQTLSRTLLTSFTVLLVVVILYFIGGQAIHGFAFALIVGVLTGTYSSIYVAAPILLWLSHPAEMKAKRPEKTPERTR